MQEVEIPRYVDSQTQILFWELDELALSVTTFGVGIVVEHVVFSMFAIVFVSMWMRRFKHRAMDGVLLHMAYWAGFWPLNGVFRDAMIRLRYA